MLPKAAKITEKYRLETGIGKVESVTATATARHASAEGAWKAHVGELETLMQG